MCPPTPKLVNVVFCSISLKCSQIELDRSNLLLNFEVVLLTQLDLHRQVDTTLLLPILNVKIGLSYIFLGFFRWNQLTLRIEFAFFGRDFLYFPPLVPQCITE